MSTEAYAQKLANTPSGLLGFVTLIGVVGAITTNVEYWNWYRFPTSYTIPYMIRQIVGCMVAGVIASWMLKPDVPALSATA
jgi:uncharacterized membrane protein YeaQ/YmgE (transglycosylase-associated protein family)